VAVTALTIATALACMLASGALFAFSAFVMDALGRLAPEHGLLAMQSINRRAVTPARPSAGATTPAAGPRSTTCGWPWARPARRCWPPRRSRW
jgi:uncharacterized membrane protein